MSRLLVVLIVVSLALNGMLVVTVALLADQQRWQDCPSQTVYRGKCVPPRDVRPDDGFQPGTGMAQSTKATM